MNPNRTVFWLALLTVVVPFLAIPEWLTQTVVFLLAVVIMITARLAYTSSQHQTHQPPQTSNRDNNDSQTHTPDTNQEDPNADENKDSSTDDPVDITDPDADQMMASNQWRRRASRDIGDSNA
jgi:cytoskeletal protein RodZ